MGIYLNGSGAYTLYRNETTKPYFVDKSGMLEELLPLVEQGSSYVCITRPRRFGKTMAADMISAYFSSGADSSGVFDMLQIGRSRKYKEHLNRHNVIQISFNKLPRRCSNYEQYINRIESQLIADLEAAYPNVPVCREDAVWDALLKIYASDSSARFLFVLDEWDFIFHRDFVTQKDKENYIDFLSSLLKNQPYVELAYMTGILPIASYTSYSTLESDDSIVDASGESLQAVFPADASYSSGSELNMFLEYTMSGEELYSEYFGFTESEVDEVYARFLKNTAEPKVTRDGLKLWYDGYHTKAGVRVYNPRSVVAALTNNNLGSYWTSSGPYDEIFYYIERNVADVRDDLARMVAGIPVEARIREYAAVSMNLDTRDEIFSAMLVYGFLSFENGFVMIPNRELMEKFSEMLQKESSLGYVNRLARESARMLKATKAGDTETMRQILEYAHDTEIPLLSYSNETDLTAVVNLVYLAARDSYRIVREDKAGIGYVDFVFYPDRADDDCIILELKVDHTAEEAVWQIRNRRYARCFSGKIGERPRYTGRILAVGIAYDRAAKKHNCIVEELERHEVARHENDQSPSGSF